MTSIVKKITSRPPTVPPSVVEYATVQALNTASGGLPSGYYSVPDGRVTYWNGSAFFPYLPLGSNAWLDIGGIPLERVAIGVTDTYPTHITANADVDFVLETSSHTDMDAGTVWSVL
jgi:hypothetical protein